jgi:hypothetical protein
VAAAVTTNDLGDGQLLPEMLDQIDEHIVQVSADGAYDTRACYAAIERRQAQAAIPPRRGARIWRHGNAHDPPLARDEILRCIRRMGRAAWKRASGYHRRSLGLRPRCFASRQSSVIVCAHAAFQGKPQRCSSVALH